MKDFKTLINLLSSSLRFSNEEVTDETPEVTKLASTTYTVIGEGDVAMDIIVEGELVAGSNVMLADGSPLADGSYKLADGSMEMMVAGGVITSVEPVVAEDMTEEVVLEETETTLSADDRIANLESAVESLIEIVSKFSTEKFEKLENELAETKTTLSKVTNGKAPVKFETSETKVDKFDRIADILKKK